MVSTLRRLVVGIAITLGVWLVPAQAQEVSPESLAASRELMALTNSDEILEQVIAMFVPQITDLVARANPEPGPAVRKIMDEMMMPEMRKAIPEAIDGIAAVYAHNFTADELNELIAFYKTPVGQKFIERQPALMTELSETGQAWGQRTAMKA